MPCDPQKAPYSPEEELFGRVFSCVLCIGCLFVSVYQCAASQEARSECLGLFVLFTVSLALFAENFAPFVILIATRVHCSLALLTRVKQ